MSSRPDPCAQFLFQLLDELGISKELLGSGGSMQARVRVITPSGQWMIAMPADDEWRRGYVLLALRPFILTRQAIALVASTSTESDYEGWILTPGGAQGIRHAFERMPRLRVTETIETTGSDAPQLVQHLSWICAPNTAHEVTWVCLRRLDEVLGPHGWWPAILISKHSPASETQTANA